MALQQDAQPVQVFAEESVLGRALPADSRQFLSLLLRWDPDPLLSLKWSCSCPGMTCSLECQPCQPRKLCLFWLDFSFPDVCFSLHPGAVAEPHLSQSPCPPCWLYLPLSVSASCFLPAAVLAEGEGHLLVRLGRPGFWRLQKRLCWSLSGSHPTFSDRPVFVMYRKGGWVDKEPMKVGECKRLFPFVSGEAVRTNTVELRTEASEKKQSHPGLSGVYLHSGVHSLVLGLNGLMDGVCGCDVVFFFLYVCVYVYTWVM